MRILVTPHGAQVVSEIEDMNNTAQSLAMTKHRSSRNYSFNPHLGARTQQNPFKNATNTSSFYKTTSRNNSYVDTERATFTQGEIKQAKHVSLKMHKISFPKNFVEKYEKDTKPSNNIITTSGSFLPTLSNKNNNDEEPNPMNKMYSFKEIIPEKTITNLKLNMINEAKQKAKLSRVTEKQFRTIYQPQTELEKFEDILECPKVAPNKLSLIKYLNESKKLSPIALKTLVESNPERISRVNKMCQILFHEEEQQRILNDIIKGKLRQKVNSDKVDFQKKIKQMKTEVDGFKSRLSKYNKRLDDRERYRDLHKDMVVHFWNKHDNYERFNKKPLLKSIHTINEQMGSTSNAFSEVGI